MQRLGSRQVDDGQQLTWSRGAHPLWPQQQRVPIPTPTVHTDTVCSCSGGWENWHCCWTSAPFGHAPIRARARGGAEQGTGLAARARSRLAGSQLSPRRETNKQSAMALLPASVRVWFLRLPARSVVSACCRWGRGDTGAAKRLRAKGAHHDDPHAVLLLLFPPPHCRHQ